MCKWRCRLRFHFSSIIKANYDVKVNLQLTVLNFSEFDFHLMHVTINMVNGIGRYFSYYQGEGCVLLTRLLYKSSTFVIRFSTFWKLVSRFAVIVIRLVKMLANFL